MDDSYRYYVPLLPAFSLAYIYFINEINTNNYKVIAYLLLIALITLRASDLYTAWNKDINWGALKYQVSGKSVSTGLNSGHIALGKWLNKHANKDSTIVISDAGAIPYFSKLRSIDTWSLCDRSILKFNIRLKNTTDKEVIQKINKEKLDYLLAQKPDYLIQDKGIISGTEYIKEYQLLDDIFTYLPNYKLRVYKRISP